jgi:DNA-binding IclR family transcriptional regulator
MNIQACPFTKRVFLAIVLGYETIQDIAKALWSEAKNVRNALRQLLEMGYVSRQGKVKVRLSGHLRSFRTYYGPTVAGFRLAKELLA